MKNEVYLTLQDIISANAILSSLNPNFEKFYRNELTQKEEFDLISYIKPNLDFRKFQEYRGFIEFTNYIKDCEKALRELASILANKADLEQDEIKNWIKLYYTPLYDDTIGLSLEDYHINNTEDYFYIPVICEYLEKKEFIPILRFCGVMEILYYNEYHKPASERTEPDPKGYYYVPPNPNDPSDLEKIQCLLK